MINAATKLFFWFWFVEWVLGVAGRENPKSSSSYSVNAINVKAKVDFFFWHVQYSRQCIDGFELLYWLDCSHHRMWWELDEVRGKKAEKEDTFKRKRRGVRKVRNAVFLLFCDAQCKYEDRTALSAFSTDLYTDSFAWLEILSV